MKVRVTINQERFAVCDIEIPDSIIENCIANGGETDEVDDEIRDWIYSNIDDNDLWDEQENTAVKIIRSGSEFNQDIEGDIFTEFKTLNRDKKIDKIIKD
jgi:hypothetical protein